MTKALLSERWQVAAVFALLALISAACGAVNNNPALERARDAYQRARHEPEVVGRAGVALDKAGQTLEQAERLWQQEKDVKEVEHLAYLVEKRVEIARFTARRRVAADEIQQLKPQRE